jgi:cystathionine beta-synthase
MDHSVVDRWIKSNDTESLLMARRLIAEEGMLVGGSSGAAMYCALEAAKELKAGQRCVVLFADGIRNYLGKFADDRWMIDYEFMEPPSRPLVAGETVATVAVPEAVTVLPSCTVGQAVEVMTSNDRNAIAIVDEDGVVTGVLTSSSLIEAVHTIGADAGIRDAALATYRLVTENYLVSRLQYALDKNDGVVTVVDMRDGKKFFKKLITQRDLLMHLKQKIATA